MCVLCVGCACGCQDNCYAYDGQWLVEGERHHACTDRPCNLLAGSLGKAAKDMAGVLARELQLGNFGFGVFNGWRKTRANRAAELQRNRENICTKDSLTAFVATRIWLRK